MSSLALSEDGSHHPGSFTAGLSQDDILPQLHLSRSTSLDVSAEGGDGGGVPPMLANLKVGGAPSLSHGGSSGYRPSGYSESPHSSGYDLNSDPGLRRRPPKQAPVAQVPVAQVPVAQAPELEAVETPAQGVEAPPAGPAAGRMWYYLSRADHQQCGPVVWAELQQLADDQTLVFTEGLGDWKVAEQLGQGLGGPEPSV